MNNKSFVRKVIYIAIIGALLIPLSMVSRPATRDSNNDIKDLGGKLAQMRDQHDLSQAKLMEIDPASETMKLATLGLMESPLTCFGCRQLKIRKKKTGINWLQPCRR